jgi:hypothetical protein
MKIMTSHSSATPREPHANRISRTNAVNVLEERAEAVLNNTSIDPQSRVIIRYALETNDPWLERLVRQAESAPPDETGADDSNREKIEALAEIICGSGEEASAALFVLMGTMQNSTEPAVIANTVKHFALNVFGIVDAQIAVLEGELLEHDRFSAHKF